MDCADQQYNSILMGNCFNIIDIIASDKADATNLAMAILIIDVI